jgi:hypothetical protein
MPQFCLLMWMPARWRFLVDPVHLQYRLVCALCGVRLSYTTRFKVKLAPLHEGSPIGEVSAQSSIAFLLFIVKTALTGYAIFWWDAGHNACTEYCETARCVYVEAGELPKISLGQV